MSTLKAIDYVSGGGLQKDVVRKMDLKLGEFWNEEDFEGRLVGSVRFLWANLSDGSVEGLE